MKGNTEKEDYKVVKWRRESGRGEVWGGCQRKGRRGDGTCKNYEEGSFGWEGYVKTGWESAGGREII